MGNVLLVAEHLHGKLPKTTLIGVTAAKLLAEKTGGKCIGLVLAADASPIANDLATYGIDVVAVSDAAFANYVADAYTGAVTEIVKQKDVEAVVATSTALGKDLLPRVAARLGAGMASDISGIESATTFQRPMWAGILIATIEIAAAPRVVSVRGTAFDAAAPGGSGNVEQASVSLGANDTKTKFVEFAETKSDRPVLTEAEIVCSGGRGLKNGENFQTVLEPLCDALGAAMGASRAAVDAGFVPNDLQIGQTGKVVAPGLYIAVGISGAIQHLAGMKGSRVIVAVNKDPEAPIFQHASYGIVADMFEVGPLLQAEFEAL